MSASVYTIYAKGVTVSASANTMIFLRPSTISAISVLRCHLSQSAAAASSEQQMAWLFTQPTSFPTLTAGVTPFQHGGPGDSASSLIGGTSGAAGTWGFNASAEGSGTKTFGPGGGFNNLNCWEWIATPDEHIIVPASSANGFGIFLATVPTNKTLWNSYITYREIG